MKCAWEAFVNLLPVRMRNQVDRLGKQRLQELRLRLLQPPELLTSQGSICLEDTVRQEDLHFIVNAASRYSPWTSSTISQGYITAPGGHRIGLCGDALVTDGRMMGIGKATSLCMRVARDFPGIAKGLEWMSGSVIIVGSPGAGKTTLLRDLIRQRSEYGGKNISVVDERGEIFPFAQGKLCFDAGSRTDILSGCSKTQGVSFVLRTMGPQIIAVDEITDKKDCDALLQAGWCGVDLLATAHAGSMKDLLSRPIYRPIVDSGIFQHVIILQQDKSWKVERMGVYV